MTALRFDRKITPYDTCDRINALVDFEPFARAICDRVYDNAWEVAIFNVDGSVTEYTVPCTDDDDADRAHVEAIISLSFRNNFAPKPAAPVKVPARNLLTGDQVGSGEIVKWVGVGVRTPRGKVEIQLEKNGRTRLAIWNASTLINVRRAA